MTETEKKVQKQTKKTLEDDLICKTGWEKLSKIWWSRKHSNWFKFIGLDILGQENLLEVIAKISVLTKIQGYKLELKRCVCVGTLLLGIRNDERVTELTTGYISFFLKIEVSDPEGTNHHLLDTTKMSLRKLSLTRIGKNGSFWESETLWARMWEPKTKKGQHLTNFWCKKSPPGVQHSGPWDSVHPWNT